MLHAVRRPVVGLHVCKPSKTKEKTPTKIPTTPSHVLELINRLLMIDIHQQDNMKQEILTSLINDIITPSQCLHLFLNTAWKDRNRPPVIAEIFLQITQEIDIDFASLIDSCHNNLLKVLTVIGQPCINDLSLVTLMANIFKMKDLEDDHRAGVEMYLVEIAKAFWPYFMHEKSQRVWNDDICDAICDVLVAVGNILEKKCPINMEKAFNNITIMMFSSSWISGYTLLRFMELKEVRASNWTLTTSAKTYYTTAYSKHNRSSGSSTSSSLISQSSLDDDADDDGDNDVFTSSSTPTIKETLSVQPNFKLDDHGDMQNSLNYVPCTPSQSHTDLVSQNFKISDDKDVPKSSSTSKSSRVSTSDAVLTDSNSKEIGGDYSNVLSSSTSDKSSASYKETATEHSSYRVGGDNDSFSNTAISMTCNDSNRYDLSNFKPGDKLSSNTTSNKEVPLADSNYVLTITKDKMSTQSNSHLVVRILELDSISIEGGSDFDSDDDSIGWAESYYYEDNDRKQSNNDTCQSFQQPDSNSWNIDETKYHFQSTGGFPNHISTSGEHKSSGGFGQNRFSDNTFNHGGFDKVKYSENHSFNVNGLTELSRPSGFPENDAQNAAYYKPRAGFHQRLSENDSSDANGCDRQSRPIGCPGNDLSNDTTHKPRHGFQRAFSENDSNKIRFGGFPRPSEFPENDSSGSYYKPRAGFQRTLSESDGNNVNRFGGFSRPNVFPGNDLTSGHQNKLTHGFQKVFSENDGGMKGFSVRNHNGQYWKSSLEFPVEEMNQECDQKSRLYLLSFALQPASLERPSDLTLTAELDKEKPWLKDVILPQPMTVVERYG